MTSWLIKDGIFNNMKRNKTLLIIEDDAFLVDAYKVKLMRSPWKVVTAANGNIGFDTAVKIKPDLVILDLLIDGMTGMDVLKKLRELPETKKTPIIIATNISQDESIKEAKRLGANDYFIKSDISISQLLEKCEKYL